MSYKISKELFEVVINKGKVKEYYGVFGKEIQAQLKHSDCTFSISINDFFFECKEWAYGKGYTILTYKMSKYPNYNYGTLIKSIDFKFDDIMLKDGKYNVESFNFGAETEQQIIFDACQRILDSKEK